MCSSMMVQGLVLAHVYLLFRHFLSGETCARALMTSPVFGKSRVLSYDIPFLLMGTSYGCSTHQVHLVGRLLAHVWKVFHRSFPGGFGTCARSRATCIMPGRDLCLPLRVAWRSPSLSCFTGSLRTFFATGRGRDESVRREAGSQWIVAARPLCHLQCPVAYLSRLQRIQPTARGEGSFEAAYRSVSAGQA